VFIQSANVLKGLTIYVLLLWIMLIFKCLCAQLMLTKGAYVVLTLFIQGFYVPRVFTNGAYTINSAYLRCPMNVVFNILRKE